MRRMSTATAALVALALVFSAAATAAETSLYIADQPGLSLTLKAHGDHVFITSLRHTGYCRGAGGFPDKVAEGGESFLGGPVELERNGRHLQFREKVTETFYSRTVLKATVEDNAIGGFYLSESSSSAEGDGGCQTGSFEGDPRVYFRAQRYVPLGSESASEPDPAAPAVYFANSKVVEMYLWVDQGAVTDVRGTALSTCVKYRRIRPHRRVGRSRESFLLDPPFPLSPADNSFATAALYPGSFKRSAYLSGTVAEGETKGLLRETSEVRESGRLQERCRTGTARRGWVPYQAIRFVQAG
jgi:hypothetical protein